MMVAERTAVRGGWRELAARRCEAWTWSGDRCRQFGLAVREVNGRLLCGRHERKHLALVPRPDDVPDRDRGVPATAKTGAMATETAQATTVAPNGQDSASQAPLGGRKQTYWDRLRAQGQERRVEKAIPAGLRERPALAPTERPRAEVFVEIAGRDDAMRAEYKAKGPTPWPEAFGRLLRAGEEAREQRRAAVEAAAQAQGARRKALTAEIVIECMAGAHGVAPADLKGKRRDQEFAYPRQLAMYALREWLKLSLSDIGKQLGGRDHTTVMYGVAKIEKELETDPITVRSLADIKDMLRDAGCAW